MANLAFIRKNLAIDFFPETEVYTVTMFTYAIILPNANFFIR